MSGSQGGPFFRVGLQTEQEGQTASVHSVSGSEPATNASARCPEGSHGPAEEEVELPIRPSHVKISGSHSNHIFSENDMTNASSSSSVPQVGGRLRYFRKIGKS